MIQNRRVIAICGGIASGKSACSNYLKGKGFCVVDLDDISRKVVACGSNGLEMLHKEFDERCFYEDGSLNRKALAEIVFSDRTALERLNALLHPIIICQAKEEIEKADGTTVFVEIQLLEDEAESLFDSIWFIRCSDEIRVARAVRKGMDEEDVRRRIASQKRVIEKTEKIADVIIDNYGDNSELLKNIDELIVEERIDK